tara:strand:- start:81 stop:1037 length:957 start_codon:yes stop_codon:yes gene_type:complete
MKVAAMAGISADEREVVETVRVHILPMEVTEFLTEDDTTILVGGPDLVPGYFDSISANMAARGDTYVPQLVEHSGPAVGRVTAPGLDADGIFLDVELWAEGVEARFGRDFVSAFWQFGEFGADGRPRVARIVENSFTPTPQFSLAQKPVSDLETLQDNTDGLYQVSATMRAQVPPQQKEPMTPEELVAFMASEDFTEAVREIARVEREAAHAEMEAAAAIAASETAAAAAEDGTADEVVEEEEAVAASAPIARALTAIADRFERLERSSQVAASLRGQQTRPGGGTKKAGVDYIVDRLERGITLDDARAENRELTHGA